jgi:alanine-synthesizing transaminase
VAPDGRLCKQRDLVYYKMTDIPGITCVKPKGAMYVFPKYDPKVFDIANDEDFALQLLIEEKILIVPGSGFNHRDNNHFRIVFLPNTDILENACKKMANFFEEKRTLISQPITS